MGDKQNFFHIDSLVIGENGVNQSFYAKKPRPLWERGYKFMAYYGNETTLANSPDEAMLKFH